MVMYISRTVTGWLEETSLIFCYEAVGDSPWFESDKGQTHLFPAKINSAGGLTIN